MANCSSLFKEFNNSIMLAESKKCSLRKSRNLLREDIKSYLKQNKPNEILPKFAGQGSYMMYTIVNPIVDETGGEYDLDDGVYFIGSAEDRKSVNTYHNWIVDAVKNRTEEYLAKNTCVRVIYKAGHHIDMPIYFIEDGNIPQLAHKVKGWIDSDPKEFYTWFNDKAKSNDQIRRMTRYFKAWADKRNHDNSNVKMPPGIVLTILAAENYSENDRDDIAFKETMENIYSKLSIAFSCFRPTTPVGEDLLSDFSTTRKDSFLSSLSSFIDSSRQAIENPNQKSACQKWQKHFGNRFSCANAKDEVEEANRYSSPAVITSSAKSGKSV